MFRGPGTLFKRLENMPGGLRLQRTSLVVVMKVWKFSQTENRVAGSVRGGAFLHSYSRFNFVKVTILNRGRKEVAYLQLRCLFKVVDRTNHSGSRWQLGKDLDGDRFFLGRWLTNAGGRTDLTKAARLKWARPGAEVQLGPQGQGHGEQSATRDFWYQVLDADTILESVQLIPIPLEGLHGRDDGSADHPDRQFYVHALGKSAAGES